MKYFQGKHFLGGRYVVAPVLDGLYEALKFEQGLSKHRFVPPSVAEKYDLDLPEYTDVDQIVEL